jgi:hypothetical protein
MWPRGSEVVVLDGMVATLARVRPMVIKRWRKKHRKARIPVTLRPRNYWRKGRDMALARYSEATGLRFRVVEVGPTEAAPFPNLDAAGLPPEGHILIARVRSGNGYGLTRPQPGPTRAAIVATYPFTGYLSHESGHVLGLAHTSPGGAPDAASNEHGVMDYEGLFGWELPAYGGHDLEECFRIYHS